MGNLVDTGLGWYLDEDYLRTVGNTTMGTIETSGGGANLRNSVVEEISYPQPSSATPYMGPFSNLPVASLGFQSRCNHNLNIYIGDYQGNNIGTARAWVFYIMRTGQTAGATYYVVSDVSGTIVNRVYSNGQSEGSWTLSSPLSGYPGFYYVSGSMGNEYLRSDMNENFIFSSLSDAMTSIGGVTHTIKKVQGGAGAFCFVSYPHDGTTLHTGVGISSIGIPNSAATVSFDDVNGSYSTFNREGMQFTMFYTEPTEGVLTSNVPTVSHSTDISALPGLFEARLFIIAADAAQIHVGFVPVDEDPYEGGGTSKPGRGNGTFDNTSDQIDDSTTPIFSFAGSGFCRIYNPNLSQLQNLANYLWTDTNFLQTIVNHAKQLLEDPIEAIISLAMLPVAVPQGTSENVKVLFINTGVSMPPATTQYVEVDCGTYNLEEYYGSALDYNPYTQVDLFLPFIGQVSLNTDEVMGHTIGVKYRVDIVSGLCVAKVFVDNDCMYQFSGNCAIFMPLNSADFSSYLSAAMTAATALVSAGAGVAAGSAAAGAEAVAEPAVQTGGNLLGVGESLVTPQMAAEYQANNFILGRVSGGHSWGETPPASLGEMERKFISNTALAVLGAKISFEHASHLAGNSGILGVRRPYLIINRPDMCNPEKYGKYNGRPCMMYLYLGNLTGYTEIQEIQLTGFSATNPELAEISKMLKGGVIF